MSYKVSFSIAMGYYKEIPEYTRFIDDLKEARAYAKSLLFTIIKEQDWVTDTPNAFIDQVELEDTEQIPCNPSHPHSAMESKHSEHFSIWDDEFYDKVRIEHVHDLHRVLFANYYEDGRNDPIEHVLKCGYNHQILDVYWMPISIMGVENYVAISALPEDYDWEEGWKDWDETQVHVYSANDPELKTLLKDIRSQIA